MRPQCAHKSPLFAMEIQTARCPSPLPCREPGDEAAVRPPRPQRRTRSREHAGAHGFSGDNRGVAVRWGCGPFSRGRWVFPLSFVPTGTAGNHKHRACRTGRLNSRRSRPHCCISLRGPYLRHMSKLPLVRPRGVRIPSGCTNYSPKRAPIERSPAPTRPDRNRETVTVAPDGCRGCPTHGARYDVPIDGEI